MSYSTLWKISPRREALGTTKVVGTGVELISIATMCCTISAVLIKLLRLCLLVH
jgi:hypothetical protein